MKKIIALAAMLACGLASAQTADSVANSGSAANAGSTSGAQSIIIMPSNPDHITTTGTISTTGTQTINTTGTQTVNSNVNGTQTVRNVPNFGMSGPASGPCTGPSGGVTVAVPGFGAGVNGASTEGDCQIREMARILAMVGDVQAAKEALYWTDAARTVRERRKEAEAAAKPAPKASGAGMAPLMADADICAQAKAKDDKPLAMRVCK